MNDTLLIIGACGQIGTELTLKLREKYGEKNIIATDIREGSKELMHSGIFEILNATDEEAIAIIVEKYQITQVYLMAAMLSVTAEKLPNKAWNLNINSLLYILNLAKDKKIKKVFWPSSIAVFGHSTPKHNTPQETITEPTTVYGISKLAGERWCAYYQDKYDVDVKSIRYPGIISWKANPGGGTTDYAIEIFHKALKEKKYDCFLSPETRLPMMYMDDAIKATIELMSTKKTTNFTSYNISAIDFTPQEIATEIQKHIPNFNINYKPDFRQKIADSWPSSVDDTKAKKDWNWTHEFDLKIMTIEMLKNLKTRFNSSLENV
ncbi:MAG: NAD-dependent epimerase/dehydratase family protein [Flavobacteriaceae bacterium]|nr:NAD-dependent epimerase/dehydratase family protein [Flavobacteriaceae bacterium]